MEKDIYENNEDYENDNSCIEKTDNYELSNNSFDNKDFFPKIEPDFNDFNIIKWITAIAFIYGFSYIIGQIINF